MQKVTLYQKVPPVATIQLKLFEEKANSKIKNKQYLKNDHSYSAPINVAGNAGKL